MKVIVALLSFLFKHKYPHIELLKIHWINSRLHTYYVLRLSEKLICLEKTIKSRIRIKIVFAFLSSFRWRPKDQIRYNPAFHFLMFFLLMVPKQYGNRTFKTFKFTKEADLLSLYTGCIVKNASFNCDYLG